MSYVGIDYGMGRTNRDPENGIRYGVISQHSVSQAWADSSEPDYGEATCPKCGNATISCDSINDASGDDAEEYEHQGGCADYACSHCKTTFDSSEAFSEEALSFDLDDGKYVASDCLDSDIIISKSPYYTFAQFCSPCVPGAGNLNNDMDDGIKSYCFSHDWFADGKAPYRVFRVSDDSEIFA